MQLRHLRTFAAVATTLNMTRAARQVHLSQSSVTEHIQALEADIGAALFDRSRRRLRLTEAGRRLLAYAGDLLALAHEARAAVADLSGLVTGTLTVGGLETLCANWLPPLLATFQAAHPSVGLHVKVGGSGDLRSGVRAGLIDLCVLFGEQPSDADLASASIAQEPLVVITPPNHRLAGRRMIGVDDLANEPFLVTEMGCVYRRIFETAFPETAAGRPRVAGELGSLGAIRALVAAGMGCALVPRLAAPGAEDGIAVLSWAGVQDCVPVVMLWRRQRVQPPALRLFVEATRQHFDGLRPGDGRLRHAARSR